MAQNDIASGLLFAGTLYAQAYDPVTGLYGAYQRYEVDKFEITTPSDKLQKISKSRESFGQAKNTYFVAKPVDFSITFDELSGDIFAAMLSGVASDVNDASAALANLPVTVVPGAWVEIPGGENLDLNTVVVKDATGTTTYSDDKYEINERLGMIYVPAGGAIAAGSVKISASTLAFEGTKIEGAQRYAHVMRYKLDGINLLDRRDMTLFAPRAVVSSNTAQDWLSGKLASVALTGNLEVTDGYASPFVLKY
ncbi:hypothetical protein [Azonexus sp. R2A61]|uniref:phage tail tube protein n=1 Tax=Azonexus sp. R2A61 TaxID=2744443 RepID=UPI001F303D4A|nr:hypothetical protein [Azonexus sp. R2A61]